MRNARGAYSLFLILHSSSFIPPSPPVFRFLILFLMVWLPSTAGFGQIGSRKPYNAAPSKKRVKLHKVSIPPKMVVQLPSDWTLMPDDAIATKYPAPRKPLAAYTSPSGQVDFVASEKSTPFPAKPGDLPILLKFFKASILNAFSNGVEFTKEEIVNLDGTDFIAFEFVSALSGEGSIQKRGTMRRYSYLLYTILPAASEKERPQLLVFNFSCPAVLADEWRPVARQVMATVRVK